MYLGKGQKPVAVAAIFDKGRLQRRFYPRDLGKINVSGKLALVQRLEIKFFNLGSIYHNHARFFGVCGIDQHLLGHVSPLPGQALGCPADGMKAGPRGARGRAGV